ncbi:hypothetical protein Pcinc_001746 [Petrolisthes cinctipes]|uniref:Uncharacterized protein n=1 Tax=Petrolisthes cinctipes TaxID=88211 RepID=A0AAE1L5T7_PETCI|nr:hypothetical protein Pcinc_001746 [Petrolisthes cinctipes]
MAAFVDSSSPPVLIRSQTSSDDSATRLLRLYATFDVSSGPGSYSSIHQVTNLALHSTPHLLRLYATLDVSSG